MTQAWVSRLPNPRFLLGHQSLKDGLHFVSLQQIHTHWKKCSSRVLTNIHNSPICQSPLRAICALTVFNYVFIMLNKYIILRTTLWSILLAVLTQKQEQQNCKGSAIFFVCCHTVCGNKRVRAVIHIELCSTHVWLCSEHVWMYRTHVWLFRFAL